MKSRARSMPEYSLAKVIYNVSISNSNKSVDMGGGIEEAEGASGTGLDESRSG